MLLADSEHAQLIEFLFKHDFVLLWIHRCREMMDDQNIITSWPQGFWRAQLVFFHLLNRGTTVCMLNSDQALV